MGTHITLNGTVFQEKYLNLSMQFPEETWQQILDLTIGDMDADPEEYQRSTFASLNNGVRTVLRGEAVMQIYRACIAECTVTKYSSWTCDRFWADMERGGYGSLQNLWPRLREKGMRDAYLSLLHTVGFCRDALPAVEKPWWLFGKGGVKGRFYGEWAALTAPDEAARISAQLAGTGTIDEVIAHARAESPDLAKYIERDHREAVAILEMAAKDSHWVLGFEFGT